MVWTCTAHHCKESWVSDWVIQVTLWSSGLGLVFWDNVTSQVGVNFDIRNCFPILKLWNKSQLEAIKQDPGVSSLYKPICSFNATCFTTFSAVLPCKCNWQDNEDLYRGSTLSWRSFVRPKIVTSCQPISFLSLRVVHARGVQCGTSLLNWTKVYILTCQWGISSQRGLGWQ